MTLRELIEKLRVYENINGGELLDMPVFSMERRTAVEIDTIGLVGRGMCLMPHMDVNVEEEDDGKGMYIMGAHA